MTLDAEAFAAEAETLAGTPFRLHGRNEAGVDCIGLVLLALARSRRAVTAPSGYALRNSDIARHLALAAANGFAAVDGDIRRGDVLLATPGPAQHHLLVALGPSLFLHAHAGLRRVAEHRGPPPWPVLMHWRLIETGQE